MEGKKIIYIYTYIYRRKEERDGRREEGVWEVCGRMGGVWEVGRRLAGRKVDGRCVGGRKKVGREEG